ncbi:MAG: hypothetical protein ACR2KG_08810 [Nocardioidaceae bacterium]
MRRRLLCASQVALLAVIAVIATAVGATAMLTPQADLANVVSTQPVACTPQVLSTFPQVPPTTVYSFATNGDTVYVGGRFSSVSSADKRTTYPRDNFFAFQLPQDGSCTMSPLRLNFNSAVFKVLESSDGTALFIGGSFTTVNGAAHSYLIKWDIATQSIDPTFNVTLDNQVDTMVLLQNQLVVGGDFQHVDGTPRTGLVSLDQTTGAATSLVNTVLTGSLGPSAGPIGIYRIAERPDGSQLAVLGNFTALDAKSREQIALLNIGPSGDSVVNWDTPLFHQPCQNPTIPQWGRGISYSPDGTKLGFATTGNVPPNNVLCDALSTWSTTATGTDQQPIWIVTTPKDTMLSVAWTSGAIYVGGHFKALRGADGKRRDRQGVGAVNQRGHVMTWNPGHSRGFGVQELFVVGDSDTSGVLHGLYVGSDTGCGQPVPVEHQGVCVLPAS